MHVSGEGWWNIGHTRKSTLDASMLVLIVSIGSATVQNATPADAPATSLRQMLSP